MFSQGKHCPHLRFSGLCASSTNLLQLRGVLEVRMPERHCVRRPLKGVHRLCQLGAAGWELFVRQFCSILLPSLQRVSWWLVRVFVTHGHAFVPHQGIWLFITNITLHLPG
jgi:hypothetical protein